MKKGIVSVMIFVSLSAMSQTDLKGLARVKKVQGVEVYISAEPLRDYTVVGNSSSTSFGSVVTELVGSQVRMSERVNIIVTKAMKKRNDKKNPIDFDAILIDQDDKGILIKFTDTVQTLINKESQAVVPGTNTGQSATKK